tara:strand:- start:18 stop:467 length:450 start_codon:yes stop_codon:yes gene_type:complete
MPDDIINQIGYNLTGNNLSKFLSVDKLTHSLDLDPQLIKRIEIEKKETEIKNLENQLTDLKRNNNFAPNTYLPILWHIARPKFWKLFNTSHNPNEYEEFEYSLMDQDIEYQKYLIEINGVQNLTQDYKINELKTAIEIEKQQSDDMYLY